MADPKLHVSPPEEGGTDYQIVRRVDGETLCVAVVFESEHWDAESITRRFVFADRLRTAVLNLLEAARGGDKEEVALEIQTTETVLRKMDGKVKTK